MASSDEDTTPTKKDPVATVFLALVGLVVVGLIVHSLLSGHANQSPEGSPDIRTTIQGELTPEETATINRAISPYAYKATPQEKGRTLYSVGNFNTEFGLRLTIVTEGKLSPEPTEPITAEDILSAVGYMGKLAQEHLTMHVNWEEKGVKDATFQILPPIQSEVFLIFQKGITKSIGEGAFIGSDKEANVAEISPGGNGEVGGARLYVLYSFICEATVRIRPTNATRVQLLGSQKARRDAAEEAQGQPSVLADEGGDSFCQTQGYALSYAHHEVPYSTYKRELNAPGEAPLVSEATYKEYSQENV